MKSPNPPPPISVASVALATTSTAAIRSPASITGRARGSCTFHNSCQVDIPNPRPASTMAGSTPRMPVSVLMSRGGIARSVSAMADGRKPIPCEGNNKNSTAILGTTRKMPTMLTTTRASTP